MHINDEIINTRWMTQFGPARAMQHTHVKLIIVLYWLHHKVATNIIAFVHLRYIINSIVIALDQYRVVWPKLLIGLKWRKAHGFSIWWLAARCRSIRLYLQYHLAMRATQWFAHCDPKSFARSHLWYSSRGVESQWSLEVAGNLR